MRTFMLMLSCGLVLSASVGCGNSNRHDSAAKDTMSVETSSFNQRPDTKAIHESNLNNAGFADAVQQKVVITQSTFGAVNPDDLDMLPRVQDATRKDTSIIKDLNEQRVFLLQPGDKGIVEIDNDDKIFVRFQQAEAWVWKSMVSKDRQN